MHELPADLVSRVVGVHGKLGEAWLQGLPARIKSLEERWKLSAVRPFPDLRYHFVAAATRSDGSMVVLKLAVPGVDLDREADCLRFFNGDGAPFLLAHDSERGAMLLERVRGDRDLTALDEAEAIGVVCNLMGRLHKPIERTDAFPSVADWEKGFGRLRDRCGGTTGPLPSSLVDEAERRFANLRASMTSPVLLHGDLHHGNVLESDRQTWLAIDPQGVIGEPAYETGAFLRNPTPVVALEPDLESLLARRVALLSEHLEIDRRRIAGWGFAQAVLSAVWSWEDHGSGWGPALAVAAALRDNLG